MTDDNRDKQPDSFLRAPQVNQDFDRAQAAAAEQGAAQQFGSQQVEETENAPRPIPPPSLDLAGASETHHRASSRDDDKVREGVKQAEKAAFLARMAEQRAQSEQSISREWGRS